MSLYRQRMLVLLGKLSGQHDVQWFQPAPGADDDRTLVLNVPSDLFIKHPGLRSAGKQWLLDIGKLGLPRRSLQLTSWVPADGVWPATVASAADGRYTVTVQF
ncbi:hypothetical protein [Rhizobacter fulvus]